MPVQPKGQYFHYKSVFRTVAGSETKEQIDELGLRVARLADSLPLLGIVFNLFKQARQELLNHIKVPKGQQEVTWTKKYLTLLIASSRAEGALSAFMTLAETALDDQAVQLKLRIQSVIELLYQADHQELITFPSEKEFSLEFLVQSLNGQIHYIPKKPKIIQTLKVIKKPRTKKR